VLTDALVVLTAAIHPDPQAPAPRNAAGSVVAVASKSDPAPEERHARATNLV
jgi:hypothetical protein